MRYEKGHKDATRDRIIDVASKRFRENGVAAVGLAGIMSDAGLTNGAFYNHFESKEDLVQAVLGEVLNRREAKLRGNSGLEAIVRDYLSPTHRDSPSNGCPTAALVAEIARHSKRTRAGFTEKISTFIPLIAAQLTAGSASEKRRKAVAIYGLLVGMLQLARAVSDRKLSDEMLESGVSAALALASMSD